MVMAGITSHYNFMKIEQEVYNTRLTQRCGNNMSDRVPFHTRHVRNFYLLVLGQIKINLQFCIS